MIASSHRRSIGAIPAGGVPVTAPVKTRSVPTAALAGTDPVIPQSAAGLGDGVARFVARGRCVGSGVGGMEAGGSLGVLVTAADGVAVMSPVGEPVSGTKDSWPTPGDVADGSAVVVAPEQPPSSAATRIRRGTTDISAQ